LKKKIKEKKFLKENSKKKKSPEIFQFFFSIKLKIPHPKKFKRQTKNFAEKKINLKFLL
jgi:hypothetical protein